MLSVRMVLIASWSMSILVWRWAGLEATASALLCLELITFGGLLPPSDRQARKRAGNSPRPGTRRQANLVTPRQLLGANLRDALVLLTRLPDIQQPRER